MPHQCSERRWSLLQAGVSAMLAVVLFPPETSASTDARAHKYFDDGCFPFQFPDLVDKILSQSANMPYKVQPSHLPVQGLHIALEGPDGLSVTWMNPAAFSTGTKFSPVCVYGSKGSSLSYVADGYSYSYTAGMFAHTLNAAYLDLSQIPCSSDTGLCAKSPFPCNKSSSPCIKSVSYKCGDKAYGFSNLTHANIQDTDVPQTPGAQIAIVGDMGLPNGRETIESLTARLTNKTNEGGVKLLLHAGDISYADDFAEETKNNSYVWVDYMNSMQRITEQVPYMTAPGNHESQFDFAAYLNWLRMPFKSSGSTSPFWFSFDYLGVHIISFSTEHDFSPNSTQHRWMEQDLKRANRNRSRVPWVIVMGHRPLYCTSLICYGRCHEQAQQYRSFLEDLLYHQHVDVVIGGHNHQYERTFPVYRDKLIQKDFVNPQAPVYVVNGGAGNPELNDPTYQPFVEWRASYKFTMHTGFMLMTPSASQLTFDYVMSNSNEIVDSFTITRK